jgi:hypothetical protein
MAYSGGVTAETALMDVPCVTLRDTTERRETVSIGTNDLVGMDPAVLKPPLYLLFAAEWKKWQSLRSGIGMRGNGLPRCWTGRNVACSRSEPHRR